MGLAETRAMRATKGSARLFRSMVDNDEIAGEAGPILLLKCWEVDHWLNFIEKDVHKGTEAVLYVFGPASLEYGCLGVALKIFDSRIANESHKRAVSYGLSPLHIDHGSA